MIQHLLGKIALQSNDWRGTIDQIRMLSEYTVKNIKWEGSEGESIRSGALEHLTASLDDLHNALVESEKEGFNPKPPT